MAYCSVQSRLALERIVSYFLCRIQFRQETLQLQRASHLQNVHFFCIIHVFLPSSECMRRLLNFSDVVCTCTIFCTIQKAQKLLIASYCLRSGRRDPHCALQQLSEHNVTIIVVPCKNVVLRNAVSLIHFLSNLSLHTSINWKTGLNIENWELENCSLKRFDPIFGTHSKGAVIERQRTVLQNLIYHSNIMLKSTMEWKKYWWIIKVPNYWKAMLAYRWNAGKRIWLLRNGKFEFCNRSELKSVGEKVKSSTPLANKTIRFWVVGVEFEVSNVMRNASMVVVEILFAGVERLPKELTYVKMQL